MELYLEANGAAFDLICLESMAKEETKFNSWKQLHECIYFCVPASRQIASGLGPKVTSLLRRVKCAPDSRRKSVVKLYK